MKIRLSGRTPDSLSAIQELADFLSRFGEVNEVRESILSIDEREMVLVAFSAQAYFDRKGYYWFSLAKTKYAYMLDWNKDHTWMVLICGKHGRYFVPFAQIKSLLDKHPSNRNDGRWDLYIRFENGQAFFGVTEIKNHLDVTDQLHHFEQIWETPSIEESYVDEAIYIPDSLPEPDRKMGQVVRVVRDTTQSRLVKQLYAYKCQICGWTTYSPRLKNLYYCEAHHVQPLGKKCRGPDHISNILALCPTHHCMMDLGVLGIEPLSLEIVAFDPTESAIGNVLTLHREHRLNQKYLKFHMENIYTGTFTGELRLTSSQHTLG
jgi:predicted HNH restriction endonuclease